MKVYLCLVSIAILKSDFCATAALADEVNVQNQDGSSLAEDVIDYDYPKEYDWMKNVPDSSNQDEYLFVSGEKEDSKSEQDETIVDVSEIKEFDSNDSLDLLTLQNDYKQFLERIINKYSSELDDYNNNNKQEEYINDDILKNDYKHILRNILNNYNNIMQVNNKDLEEINIWDIDSELNNCKQYLSNISNIYYNIMDDNNNKNGQEDNFNYDILLDDYKQFLNKLITFNKFSRTIFCSDTSKSSKDCIQFLNTAINYFTKLMDGYSDKNEQEKDLNDVINDNKQYLNSLYDIHSDTMNDFNNKDVFDSLNQDEHLFESGEKENSESVKDKTIVDDSEIKEFDNNDFLGTYFNQINDLLTLQNDYKQFLESIINKYSSELDGLNNNTKKEDYINDDILKNDYKHILRNILNNYNNIIYFYNNGTEQMYNLDIDSKLDHYKQFLNNIPNIYYDIMDGNNNTKGQEDNFIYDTLLDDYKQFLNKLITVTISLRDISCDISKSSKDCIQYLNTTINYFTKLMDGYSDKNEQEKNFNDVINDYKHYLNSFYNIHSDILDDFNNKDVSDSLNQDENLFESGEKKNSNETIVDVSEIKEFDSNDFLDLLTQNDYKQFLESIVNKYSSELDGYNNNNEKEAYINDDTLKNDYKHILRNILNNYNNIIDFYKNGKKQMYNLDIDSKLDHYKQFLTNIPNIYYNIMDGNNNTKGQEDNFNYEILLDDYKQFLNKSITLAIFSRDISCDTSIGSKDCIQYLNTIINYLTKLMYGYSDKNGQEKNFNDVINDFKQYLNSFYNIHSALMGDYNNKDVSDSLNQDEHLFESGEKENSEFLKDKTIVDVSEIKEFDYNNKNNEKEKYINDGTLKNEYKHIIRNILNNYNNIMYTDNSGFEQINILNNNEIDVNNFNVNLQDKNNNKISYDLEDYIKGSGNRINSEPDYKEISNFRSEETNNDLIVPEDIANILLNMPKEDKIVKIKSDDSIVYVLSLDSLNQKKENTYYSNVDAENTVRRSSSTRGAILVVGIMLLALGSLFMIFIIKLRTRKNKPRASVSKCPEYESLPVQDV